jgi:arylsulfatase A-like enzyme
MRFLLVWGSLIAPWWFSAAAWAENRERPKPNILFIAIDDLNDWVGPLGGHPLAKTPRLDALAARGTTFTNAHCQAPLCNPSRVSLLTGLRPSTTGIYGLAPSFRDIPEFADRVTLPQYFAEHGYRTAGDGKIFHHGTRSGDKKHAPDFQENGNHSGVGSKPPLRLVTDPPLAHPLVDWGVWPTDNDDTKKGDYVVASWGIDQIRNAPADKPFFLALGFFLPHVPMYATQQWFDLYPDDDSILPPVLDNDRDDTPRFSWYLHWQLPEPRIGPVRAAGQWRNLVRSYLASTSFVDAQVGRLLDALDASGHRDDTIVVVWSDHGWHLGEKGIAGKNSLWDRSTRVPLVFAGPGVAPGQACKRPVELLDLYPTLVELAGLPPRDDQEGESLVPLLRDAAAPRARPAITTHNRGNHAVRSERWRYIRYADGSEELYDLENDPHEWHNLAGIPAYAAVIAEHVQWLPTVNAPLAPGSAHRIVTYDPATDICTVEGISIKRTDPLPISSDTDTTTPELPETKTPRSPR